VSKLDFGSLPQWLLFVAVSTFGMWLKWKLGADKLAIDAKTVEVNAEGELKGHYSKELQSLRDQVIKMGQHHLDREREIDDRWRKLLAESEARHDECVAQREALADKVKIIEQRQLSQVRQFLTYQQSVIRVLPDNMKSPEMMAALEALTMEINHGSE